MKKFLQWCLLGAALCATTAYAELRAIRQSGTPIFSTVTSDLFCLDKANQDSGISRLGAASLAIGTCSIGDFSGSLKLTGLTVAGLTATRIPFAGTGGLLTDNSGLTFSSNKLTAPTSAATTQFLAPMNGGVAAPGYSFTGSTTSGWDWQTGNQMVLISGGFNIGLWKVTAFTMVSQTLFGWVASNSDATSGAIDTGVVRLSANQIGSGVGAADFSGSFKASFYSTGAPNTQTGATYSVLSTDTYLIFNRAGTVTVTLPTAAAPNVGRRLVMKTITANTVVSASSNVVPQVGGAAGTAILAATAGKFAELISNGTNWEIFSAN